MRTKAEMEILTDSQKVALEYFRTGRLDYTTRVLCSATFQHDVEFLAANGFIETRISENGGLEISTTKTDFLVAEQLRAGADVVSGLGVMILASRTE